MRRLLRNVDVMTGLDGQLTARYLSRFVQSPAVEGGHHLLLAPPGLGNLGDQCMVGAFLENTSSPVILVTRHADDLVVPECHRDRVRVVPINGLLHGRGRSHARSVAQLGGLLAQARSVSVVGADVMDGAYNLRASVRRAGIAAGTCRAGIDTRVVGFSWNDHPRRAALSALRDAASSGVSLCLRDPVSAARARADGLTGVVDTADIVFAARTFAADARMRLVPFDGPYAVVNASGLLAREWNQVAELVRVISHLTDRGLSVLLLPHVIRESGDDLRACRAVFDALDESQRGAVALVESLPTPADVRGIAADATVVITGRMHLAINALWSGVPAIVFASQGKVEGLAQLFDQPGLCVEPGHGSSTRILAALDRLLLDGIDVGERSRARIHHVRSLSERNLAGLEA